MKRVAFIALVALVALVLVGCPKATANQFDLICETAWSATEPNSHRVGPVTRSTIRYTIDLDKRFWCTAGGCPQGVRNPVKAFTDTEIVLSNGPGDYLKVNRVNGLLFGYLELTPGGNDTRESTTGRCRKAPFSMPKAMF